MAKAKSAVAPKKSKAAIEKPDHISPSQIEAAKCLLHYRMTRLEHKYTIPSVYADEGKLFHECINLYTQECLRQKIDADFDVMREIFDTVANQFPSLDEENIRAARDKLMMFAESGVKHEIILEHERRSRIEVAGAIVEMVLDRVNCYRIPEGSVLEIIDYKNHRRFLTEEKVEAHPQLMIYRYAAACHLYPGYDFIRSGIYHTQYNKTVWSPLKRIGDCQVEFEGTETFILRQWKRIMEATEKELSTPTPCEVCWRYGGCPVMLDKKCPIYMTDQIKRAVHSKNLEEKVRAARYHDIMGSQMVSDLKLAFDDMDRKEIDGREVGFKPVTTVKYSLPGFIEFCTKRGIHLDGLEIGKTEVEKILKHLERALLIGEKEKKELDAIRTERHSSTFEYK